jgi:hemerythrin-like domain-containing protein
VGALPKAREGGVEAIASVKNSLGAYVKLLRAHIMKENNILFPMSDRILSRENQSELEKAFDIVEAEEMGEGIHEKYHALAHELASKF